MATIFPIYLYVVINHAHNLKKERYFIFLIFENIFPKNIHSNVKKIISSLRRKGEYLGANYMKEIGSLPVRTRNKTVLSLGSTKH